MKLKRLFILLYVTFSFIVLSKPAHTVSKELISVKGNHGALALTVYILYNLSLLLTILSATAGFFIISYHIVYNKSLGVVYDARLVRQKHVYLTAILFTLSFGLSLLCVAAISAYFPGLP